MKLNEQIAVSTPKVLLVPYDKRHVTRYHQWMSDPVIQEATASEPLTLEEEYENQESWRESHDKLTFILCQPVAGSSGPSSTPVDAGQVDSPERMIGDINFFLYPWDDEQEEATEQVSGQKYCIGEIDIMIASQNHRGKGLGKAAVSTFLHYIHGNLDAILGEYVSAGQDGATSRPKLKLLMAKINQTNAGSIALFKSIGFVQEGEVNYFGEVKLVLQDFERIAAKPEDYKVVEYARPAN